MGLRLYLSHVNPCTAGQIRRSALLFSASLASCWAVEGEGSAGPADVSVLLGMKRWSPYAAGFGIGVLSWVAFLLMGQGLGASSSFSKTSGMIEKAISGEKAAQKAYYREFPPRVDRGWMIVAEIVVGSFLSSKLSGDFLSPAT